MKVSFERVSHNFLELNSCGRQVIDQYDRGVARKYGRKDYHILYIVKGFCHLENQTAGAGTLILFHPDEPQYYRFFSKDQSISLYLHFSGTGCKDLLQKSGIGERVTYIGNSARLERIFEQLLDEHLLQKPCSNEICAGLLWQFIGLAGQKAKQKGQRAVYPEKNLDAICRRMHKDYFKNHSITEYAAMAHLSESRFSHAFKEQTGLSPKAYLTRIRVDHACRLLEDPQLSLAEVAAAVGIEDTNYFSRLIKKYTGHTPSHFRSL